MTERKDRMKRLALTAILTLLGAVVLGATVFRDQMAQATGLAGTAPVSEQNVDSHGLIRTHEQGTADVNVTNSSLQISGTPSVKLDSSGNTVKLDPSNNTVNLGTGDSSKLSATNAKLDALNTKVDDVNTRLSAIQANTAAEAPVADWHFYTSITGLGHFQTTDPISFGGTHDVSLISIETAFDHDNVRVFLITATGTVMVIANIQSGERAFPVPIRATGIQFECANAIESCNIDAAYAVGH
jgi:hypothetical protein